jgi:hypothetical protein
VGETVKVNGKDYVLPVGTIRLPATDYTKFDNKNKNTGEKLQEFAIVDTKNGQKQLVVKIESFGKDTAGSSATDITPEGKEYIKEYQKLNPKATEDEAHYAVKTVHPEFFEKSRSSSKENPVRWENFSGNQANMKHYIPRGKTVDEVTKEVLTKAGIDWKTASMTDEQRKAYYAKQKGGKDKSSTSKPKQITQNGFTYTLNESTGQYE